MEKGFEVHLAIPLNKREHWQLKEDDKVTYTKTCYKFGEINVKTVFHEALRTCSGVSVNAEFFFFPPPCSIEEGPLDTTIYDIKGTSRLLSVTFNKETNEYVDAFGLEEMTLHEYRKVKIQNLLADM